MSCNPQFVFFSHGQYIMMSPKHTMRTRHLPHVRQHISMCNISQDTICNCTFHQHFCLCQPRGHIAKERHQHTWRLSFKIISSVLCCLKLLSEFPTEDNTIQHQRILIVWSSVWVLLKGLRLPAEFDHKHSMYIPYWAASPRASCSQQRGSPSSCCGQCQSHPETETQPRS